MAPKDQPICRDAEKGRTKRKVPLPWDFFFFPLLSFNCLHISFSLHHFITTLHTFFFPLFIIMFGASNLCQLSSKCIYDKH